MLKVGLWTNIQHRRRPACCCTTLEKFNYIVFDVSNVVLSGNMWVTLTEKNQWPQTLQIWTHWTITYGAPRWKSRPTINYRRSPIRLINWKSNHVGRAAARPHQQGGGKLHQALDWLRRCQWWPLWAWLCPASSLRHLSSTKNGLFTATHILPEIDWLSQGFTFNSTQNRSFRICSSQLISWLVV